MHAMGDIIDGRYAIRREIASNGHGAIFEVEQRYTGRGGAPNAPGPSPGR